MHRILQSWRHLDLFNDLCYDWIENNQERLNLWLTEYLLIPDWTLKIKNQCQSENNLFRWHDISVFVKLFESRHNTNQFFSYSLKWKILTVWKGKFWQFGKENFDSLERKILTVWQGNFWQLSRHCKFGDTVWKSLEHSILLYLYILHEVGSISAKNLPAVHYHENLFIIFHT
jgi:hypothetical protein